MKEKINPVDGPPAVGPYSPAIRANGFVFLSGQIPIDPTTGDIYLGDFEGQARLVLENIKRLLKASGSSLEQVVRVGVFLKDLGNFEELNRVYSEYFGESQPARSTVEVSRLPKGVSVEMDVIALD